MMKHIKNYVYYRNTFLVGTATIIILISAIIFKSKVLVNIFLPMYFLLLILYVCQPEKVFFRNKKDDNNND